MKTAIAALAFVVLMGCTPVSQPDSSSDSKPTASLTNTYWKLLSVNGQAVTVAENQREPHFVLHLDDHRLAGFAGCNHLVGRHRIEGEELRFEEVGSTLMACEHGMEAEGVFLNALRDTTRWKIEGERLDLFDAAGRSLAKFESVYLR
jgi:heat shock protein HslJ